MEAIREVVEYRNKKAMDKGNAKRATQGWTIESVTPVQQGYGCLKTGCLGILFLPLALLGKKPVGYLVTYVQEGQ